MTGLTEKGRVTVLGINGRIGQEIAKAFVADGWQVSGMGRDNRARLDGVKFVQGDAAKVADIGHAVADVEIVVNALNLPYDKWDKGRAEAQLANVLKAMGGEGKVLMFPANIYNFAAKQHVLTPETPYQPEKDKGEIRVRMEAMIEAAARRGDISAILIRSADFYAPFATETNFDLAILSQAKAHKLMIPHAMDVGHSWAYLPDLAKVYVRLAGMRDQLGPFERFHFAGHFADGHRLVSAIQAVLPTPYKVAQLPWGLLRLMGLFVPVIREVVKMSYLFREPHRLEDKRLDEIMGAQFGTPFEEAVATTIRSYIPDARPLSSTPRLVAA